MRNNAHAGGKSPVQTAIDRQIIHVRRIDGDPPAKPSPDERLDLKSILGIGARSHRDQQQPQEDRSTPQHLFHSPSDCASLSFWAGPRIRRCAFTKCNDSTTTPAGGYRQAGWTTSI